MLKVLLTATVFDKTIFDIDGYFDTTYEPEWIDNDFAREIIKDVDKSTVVAPRIIDSPYLGYVDPTQLSGGVKCVLCLLFDNSDWMFDITVCGDNCASWIQKVGEQKDITVQLGYLMQFPDLAEHPLEVLNTKQIVRSQREFARVYAGVRDW